MQTRYKSDSPCPKVFTNPIRTRCGRWRRQTRGVGGGGSGKTSSIMHMKQNSLLSKAGLCQLAHPQAKPSLRRPSKKVKEVTVLREFPLCMCKKCLWEKHMVLVGEAEEQTALSCTGLGATAAIMAQEKRPVKCAWFSPIRSAAPLCPCISTRDVQKIAK